MYQDRLTSSWLTVHSDLNAVPWQLCSHTWLFCSDVLLSVLLGLNISLELPLLELRPQKGGFTLLLTQQ